MLKTKKSFLCKSLCVLFNIVFALATICPLSIAQTLTLPPVGTTVLSSDVLNPVMLKGLKVDPQNPFVIDFIVDQGDMRHLSTNQFKQEGERLIKYFLTAMTIPDEDIWVNLSPYESDHLIPEVLGSTLLGKDMLEQDYILKQFTASLIHPDSVAGQTFWGAVHQRSDIEEEPTDTFNKVWIMPSKAVIYEATTGAYVVENELKVATDFDYKAMKGEGFEISEQQENVLKTIQETIIPLITKEVNEGKNFIRVRQMYNALLLAQWYKIRLQQSLLNSSFAEQNKVAGDQLDDQTIKNQIYSQYLEAFQKGVFNLIKEDYDESLQQIVPRQYFSGGLEPISKKHFMDGTVSSIGQMPTDAAQENPVFVFSTNIQSSDAQLASQQKSDAAELTVDRVLGNVKAIQEQWNINTENLNHMKFIAQDGDIKFYEGSFSEVQGIGYGLDRKNQSIVVTPDFMLMCDKEALEV